MKEKIDLSFVENWADGFLDLPTWHGKPGVNLSSRGVLLPVNWYGIPNLYPKSIENKNLKIILNELSPNTMSYTIDSYIIFTFSIVNNPYPCYLYMFITEILLKFTSMSFCSPALKSPAENSIPKKNSGYVTGNHTSSSSFVHGSVNLK